MKLILYFFISIVFRHVFSLDPCESHQTCDTCIRDSKACVWCPTETNFTMSRCISKNFGLFNWCPDDIIDPESTLEIKEKSEFNSSPGKIIQIKPQRIKMNLRPGQALNFDFSFYPAEDYPVDLYFLFDASTTMKSITEKTAKQTKDLYTMMKAITKNVTLGLGYFVDKNAFPFTNIKNSRRTYSFKHKLKLSDDYTLFGKLVKETEFGANFDYPEGGLDALAQVIVCKDLIGWREESRKIVVFLTEDVYHAAGDGKWAGIIDPYDGKCYTENQTYTYTKELEMDYPSVSIINKLASDEEVIIIFLITKERYAYENLRKSIKGARVISFNGPVSETLTSIYKDISLTLKLKVNMPSMFKNKIKFTFSPNCYDNNTDSECVGNPTTETHFVANIELLEYIDAKDVKIEIGFEGVKEKLTLDLEIIKDCDCVEGNDGLCNGGGIRRCGKCECFPDRHGENCMCTSTWDMTKRDTEACKASNSSLECSGHGSCVCGACVCENGYKGTFCDCGTTNCPSNKDGMCGNHGSCDCGGCSCHSGWAGETCSCSLSTTACETSPNHIKCFDYGTCQCGDCKCPKLCEWDARGSTDTRCRPSPCPTCHGRQCFLLEPFALEATTCNNDFQCDCNKRVTVTKVENLTVFDEDTWNLCPNVRVSQGCYTKFIYKYHEERYEIVVIVQSEHDCAASYYMIGAGCLGSFILIGILTLLGWKACTTYRDRREYDRFIKQQAIGKMEHHNPLFKPSSATYNNPVFRKQSIF